MGTKGIDLFDCHCDAVMLRCLQGGGLRRNEGHVDLERAGRYGRYGQFFALFGQPEAYPGGDWSGLTHREIFRMEYALFTREMEANRDIIVHCRTGAEAEAAFAGGKMAAFLSVEGAELLDCSLERLEQAYELGVRAVNLTWNCANALSGSNCQEPERGLTPQGRAFVGKMERLGMLVDVSHLSDPGFWDVAQLLDGPFIASHSNARSVFPHARNLTDEQFTAIIEHGGVAGLNLYGEFLGRPAELDTVVAHLEHWLELGGAQAVCLGCDLDGCSILPHGIQGVQDLEKLYERLLRRNYSEDVVRGVFYQNLMRVVSKVCIM